MTPGDEALTAEIPYERGADLTREIDLIEEVGRIRGLGDIPAELPRLVGTGRLHPGPGAGAPARAPGAPTSA